MNKKMKYILMTSSIIIISGCGAKLPVSDFYKAQKMPNKVSELNLKSTKKDIESIVVDMTKYAPNNIDIASKHVKIKDNSRIVISIPDSMKTNSKTNYEHISSFRTAGYFNIAEQYVEKSLIREGFDIIDRARLEAKIRDLNHLQYGTRKTYKSDTNTSNFKYISESTNMFDKAEVIRAAKSGEVKAEYILQINNVNVSYNLDNHVDVSKIKEINDYLNKRNITFGTQGLENQFPTFVYIPMYVAQFNAKLTNVDTGSVIWIGNNLNDSRSAQDSKIQFTIEKAPYNIDSINKEIIAYNIKIENLYNRLIDADKAIKYELSELDYNKVFDSEGDMILFKNEHEKILKQNISTFKELVITYNNTLSKKPQVYINDLTYTYKVVNKQVLPVLKNENLSDKELTQYERDLIRKHKSELVNKLISSTIKTISND